jgi:hypothetical protein
MKSYPSNTILNDATKKNSIDRILNDMNTNLTTYTLSLSNAVIKQKQMLSTDAKQVLMLPEHQFLLEILITKYPERQLNGKYSIKFFLIQNY